VFIEHLEMNRKFKNSVLGHLLAINVKNCLYFLMQRIYIF